MKTLIICLCIATTVAWRSGVYILDETNNQFYTPLTQPHEQLDLGINLRGNKYGVAEKLVAKTQMRTALNALQKLREH